jgi:two-component system, LytTR family, response regulator LytT
MARQITTPGLISGNHYYPDITGLSEGPTLKILIVEDEEYGARKLSKLICEIESSARILGITDGVSSTIKWLQETSVQPDLIFMDVELSDGQSFEVFSSIQVKSPVIFTTSYDEHALRAFKHNGVDYLLKPVKKEDLEQALEKWKNLRLNSNAGSGNGFSLQQLMEQLTVQQAEQKYRNRFLVKQGSKFVPVSTDQIAYIYSSHKLTFLKTRTGQRFVIDHNLESLEPVLNPSDFFRANRQFILGSSSIREVHSWFNGKLKVVVIPESEDEVIISREKARDFRNWLGA